MNTAVRTVTKIEANPMFSSKREEFRQLRVAAYCRVSTDDEDQINSYNTQVAFYTEYISSNPKWKFVGIYADEGVTGTMVSKRKGFQDMIKDCEKHKIDLILTKSISRFARNTVESLTYVRKLKAMNIGVMFEEQNINSLTTDSEMFDISFTEFDDIVVRRIIDCIKVVNNEELQIIVKGGLEIKEKIHVE